MRDSLLGDIVGGLESEGSAHGAEPIDEYRELAMLAHAWERGTLAPRTAKRAVARVDDAEGKEPALC